MFLTQYMNLEESSIPDLADAQLEYAVSLESAYNDAMLELCQLKYQALVEGVDVIHEGVIESIKNFFGKLFSSNEKFFDSISKDTSSQDIDNLKKQSNDHRIAAGIRYMLKHPEISKKYKLIGHDTVFLNEIDFDSGRCTAADKVIDRIEGDSKPDGDEIALDVLRTFIKSAFGGAGKIKANQINSLADFKKALYNHVQYLPMNELFKNDYNKSDRDVQMCLDKMKSRIPNAVEYRKAFEKNTQIYVGQVITLIAKKYPNRVSIACKATKVINQACMIAISYGQWLNVEIVHTFSQVFNAAKKINVKED